MVDTAKYPFYSMVPKGYAENIAFREKLIKWGSLSRENAETLWIMCSRDVLFYVNAFCFTHDSRLADDGQYPIVPFITYECQDVAIDAIYTAIGRHDILVEKSRQMGGSWLCLVCIEHKWHFNDFLSFLLLSAKEELVEKKGVPKTLFYKIDLIHKYLPGWLRPSKTRTSMKLINNDTNSVVDGEATTGDMGRGSNQTAILLDEFATIVDDDLALSSTRDATRCRIFNSTPARARGKNCAFYRLTQKPDDEIRKVRLHWSEHPIKAEGLYYDDKGKPRSPWYDLQCKRAVDAAEIACELDIDYEGATSQFFSAEMIERLKAEACPPVLRGELTFDSDSARNPVFIEREDGEFWLWERPNEDGGWDESRRFSIGADVSHGTGASNSALSITDTATGRKIGEWANCTKKPYEWGRCATAMCRWFNKAFLIWEGNGPGREFGDEVISMGYRNFFYRRKERRLSKDSTEDCGWYATPETKAALLGAYKKALHEKTFINPSARSLSECVNYVYLPTGGIEHNGARTASDPSGARQNHADMVVADALSCKGVSERPAEEAPAEENIVPWDSLQARRDHWERHKRVAALW